MPDVDGGFILLARKILSSGIMEAPALHLKLWVWMLLKASHKKHGGLERGQLFTSIEKMRQAMSHKVGARIERPTRKQIRAAYESLMKGTMIGTVKGTRGLLISVLNYDRYQTPAAYEGHDEGPAEKSAQGTLINKNGLNKKGIEEPRVSLSSLKARYNPALIEQAFKAFASIRKTGKVAESVLIGFLEACARYPVENVEGGIRTYLEKGHTEGERYCLGIIRRWNGNGQSPAPQGLEPPSDAIRGGFDIDTPEGWQQYQEAREGGNERA
ncbi:MAG: hypothetical protein AB1640_07290 [bacterium]